MAESVFVDLPSDKDKFRTPIERESVFKGMPSMSDIKPPEPVVPEPSVELVPPVGPTATPLPPTERKLEISTLKEQPKGFMERIVPKFMKPGALTPEDKARATNIISLAEETGLPPSFVESQYDKISRQVGMRGQPTRQEFLEGVMVAALTGGLITAPLATIAGLATYMGTKEAESLGTQLLKGEKPQILAGRELKEFLGPLKEPYSGMVDMLEVVAPGALSAKFMGKLHQKLGQKLKEKMIHEAWESAAAKRAEIEKGKLLPWKGEAEAPTPTGEPLALPPGQGFQIVEPKPKTILKKKGLEATPVEIAKIEKVGPPKGKLVTPGVTPSVFEGLPSEKEVKVAPPEKQAVLPLAEKIKPAEEIVPPEVIETKERREEVAKKEREAKVEERVEEIAKEVKKEAKERAKVPEEAAPPIGETIMGRTAKDKFVEGIVAEVDENGDVRVGMPDGTIEIVPKDNVLTVGEVEPVSKQVAPVKKGLKEPVVTLDRLEKEPTLADFVLRRPKIHAPEVVAKAKEIKGEITLPKLTEDELGTIRELRQIVKEGEAGKRVPTGEGFKWTGFGSTFPGFMRNKGWSKLEVLSAVDKGIGEKKLTPRQQEIFDAIVKESKGLIEEGKEREIAAAKEAAKEPWVTEAMEPDEAAKVTEAKEPGEVKEPAPSPVARGEQLLPGVKVGLKFPEKGIEAKPTLEGTPLMEAAVKEEREKAQPKLGLGKEVPQAFEFRKFVESKGIDWKSFNTSHPDYPNLKAAWDRVRSEKGAIHIPTRQELSEAYERTRETRESVYQSTVNRFASIENLDERARALGATILPGESPKLRSREYLGIAQKVESVLRNKTYKITPEGKIEITGEGLKPVLDAYEKLSPEKNTKIRKEDFNTYFIAVRTIKDLQRPRAEWAKEDIVTPAQVSAAERDLRFLKKKYGSLDIFEKIAPRFYDYKNRVLHLLVDSGNMSQETYDRILELNPHHVSFRRIIDDVEPMVQGGPKVKRPFTGARTPIKRIKGSERPIHDVIESAILDTYRIMDVAERNTVARTVANLKDVLPDEIVEKQIQIVPLTRVKHHAIIDEKFMKDLSDFAGKMGATFKTGREVTPGRALGTYRPATEEVMHRQATRSDTFAHETGHFFDDKFGLKQRFYKRGESKDVAEELIAHMENIGESKNRMKKPEERFARGFEWWLTHRDLAERDLPLFSKAMEKIISDVPELKPILDIRPTPHKGFESQEVTIFGPSPFPPKGNVIEYFEDGKRKYIEVPENLYKAMSGLSEASSDLLTKILSAPATLLRTGVTSTPEFMVRNFIRDQMDAYIQSQVGFRPAIDSIAALADIIGKSDLYYDWLRTGGGHSTFVDLSEKSLERVADRLRSDPSALKYLNVINDAQEISQAIEQSTRLAVYKAGIKRGLTPVEAAFQAREATVDFGVRGGSRSLRAFSSMTAFFNPAIQGTIRFARAHRQNPWGTVLKTLLGVTLPTIFLWAVNKDDPDYAEVPRWQKDLFWLVKVGERDDPITWVRIPKPFLYGQVYGSALERFLSWATKKDPKAMDEFVQTLIDSSTPAQGDPAGALIPTGLRPLIENATNWNFFREAPIIPESRKGLLPEYQYGKYTTETAKLIGKSLGWSPSKIENFVRGVAGGTGQYSLEAMDMALRLIEAEKEGKRPREWSDVPLVKGFVTRPVESDPQSLRDFYEDAKKLDQSYMSYRDTLKTIKGEEATEIFKKYPKLSLSPSIASIRENISALNNQIDLIAKSRTMNDLVKRTKIRELEKLRLEWARLGNKFMGMKAGEEEEFSPEVMQRYLQGARKKLGTNP